MITIFAAADYQYFYDHGIAFAKSCNRAGHRCLIYIFPDTQKNFEEERKKLLLFLTKEFYPVIDSDLTEVQLIPHTVMKTLENSGEIIDKRALFASVRFMFLYDVLVGEDELNGNSVLVLDIDSVVNKKVKIPKKIDIGIFLRENQNIGSNEYEKMGMKVAAGALYVTIKALPFIEKFSSRLIKSQKRWFCDQFILYLLYKENENSYTYMYLDNNFLDWEFKNKNAIIYTGKGPRKNSPEYLKIKEELSE